MGQVVGEAEGSLVGLRVGSSVGAKVGNVEGESAKEKKKKFFWRVKRARGVVVRSRQKGGNDEPKRQERQRTRRLRGGVRGRRH